jgi:hypothetical protein
MRNALNAAAAVLLCALPLAAGDFSGIWVGQIPVRNGLRDIAIQLEQRGNAVHGKLYGDYVSAPITESTVSGGLLTFVVIAQEQAGNQINDVRVRFTGRLVDGEIELIREREGGTTAGSGGDVAFRDRERAKQIFRVKRLI